jgi:hypothetical protein
MSLTENDVNNTHRPKVKSLYFGISNMQTTDYGNEDALVKHDVLFNHFVWQ